MFSFLCVTVDTSRLQYLQQHMMDKMLKDFIKGSLCEVELKGTTKCYLNSAQC